jgi:protein arginine N-methyltransferase 1
MYTISQYGNMYISKARMNAFEAALREIITTNSVVLDIGTGTGIFALLACRYGARHVYAIEPDDAIDVGRQAGAANGYSNRITFIQSRSTNITLPEPVDIIVSDLGGLLPLYGRHIPSIIDARTRFLTPCGALIPQQDHLRVAIIQALR